MATLKVSVTKSKGGFVEIDTDKIPTEVYAEALALGMKVLVNRGASKVTGTAFPKEDELKAEALRIAQEQVDKINSGKIKFTGQKAAKASGAVMTEARRIARNLVKDAIKADGGKISHYEASEITKAANELLKGEDGAAIIEEATANLKAREENKPKAINVKAIQVSDKKVKAAEAKKKATKEPLSAKQAGMTAKAKPKAPVPQAKPSQASTSPSA